MRGGVVSTGAQGRLWVAVSARFATEDEVLKYEVLLASNDHDRARHEGGRRAAELGMDVFAVKHVAALRFGEGALEAPGQPRTVEVVLRFESRDPGNGRVQVNGGVVAVVPTKGDVETFIAERTDMGRTVVYFGSTCPLRLNWMH